MTAAGPVTAFLAQEARALLTRLAGVKSFSLQIPSVLAAAVSPPAQTAVENHIARGRRTLRRLVLAYLRWLHGREGQRATPAEAQGRFTFLRLRFNSMLSQFDIFADAMVQRTEHENGVRLSGLDAVAADALTLPGGYYPVPPVICYLDRGHGAAIRRLRTRLPGGGENPVAIIRVPRERMVGSGIASSLVHEVGHQGAALLNLIASLRPLLRAMQEKGGPERLAWEMWDRCISEIVADFWAVAKIGVSATTGLIGVVSLPRAFVFRINLEDPHPFPWIRVRLSCAMGRALYPHPQWARLERLWDAFYSAADLDPRRQEIIALLLQTLPAFVALLVNHRPPALAGRTVPEVLGVAERQPTRLTQLFQTWGSSPAEMRHAAPTLVFAVIGQARSEGAISPEEESRLLTNMLTYWALRGTLDLAAYCPRRPPGGNRMHPPDRSIQREATLRQDTHGRPQSTSTRVLARHGNPFTNHEPLNR
jgi:hypothetical protein